MPGVMQQNRLESRVEINHPWRQGREEEEEEEVSCSRASLHLTKPHKPQAGSGSRAGYGHPMTQRSGSPGSWFSIPWHLPWLHLVAGKAWSCQE